MLIDNAAVDDFEIVIGLVAPIGTDLNSVSEQITDELRVFGYSSDVIRLSQLLDIGDGQESIGYYGSRMDAGDAIRAETSSGDAVAALAVAKMLELRQDDRNKRHAWILRTLKHDDEVRLLREVFGRRFVLIGVQESKKRRTQFLTNKLADEAHPAYDIGPAVEGLISRDEFDSSNKLGQRVRETFSMSDFFLNQDEGVNTGIVRLVGLLFGAPFLTPTRDESAMFHAYGSSLRSSDPGRQVGAVIANPEGDILAIGTNEVPRHGGGEYWAGDSDDHRDHKEGFDFNKRQSRRVLVELVDQLAADGHLTDSLTDISSEARFDSLWKKSEAKLKSTRVMSLIEFGRVVHAEMSALMQAARQTTSVQGGTIFVTAFPCHMCMRLIVASGIARVVYVDPYPKSLAFEMYGDSISDDPLIPNRVKVEAFSGVGWRLYTSLFKDANRRRDANGAFLQFDKSKARFRLAAADPLLGASEDERQVVVALSAARDTTYSNIHSNKGES